MSLHPGFRLGDNPIPMKLCHRCSELSIDVLSKHKFLCKNPIEHQPDFTALLKSASAGCEMCLMFLDGVTEVYCGINMKTCSRAEAHQSFAEAESRGKGSCQLTMGFSTGDDIHEIRYTIPCGNFDCQVSHTPGITEAYFKLRNCRGTEDKRVCQTELALVPDWNITREWIQTCVNCHEKCSNRQSFGGNSLDSHSQPLNLPTRVLEVGLNPDEEPRLIETGDLTGEYVTLSHCWGNAQRLVTTLSNISHFLQSVPLSSMPKTFQDAVMVTRNLGFRYLWIDSLCIIQDSVEDWQQECANMAQIYQCSVLTICGPAATDSSSGFLHSRTCPEPRPYLWEYINAIGEPQWATFSIISHRTYAPRVDPSDYPNSSCLTDREGMSALQHRCWILQEYLLSSRLLFFGLYRMYWECNTCIRFEDFPHRYEKNAQTPERFETGLHCTYKKGRLAPRLLPRNIESTLVEWLLVVTEYSHRVITHPSDKLPAISGIAQWLLRGKSEDYLAGVLRHSIHECLAMFVQTTNSTKTQTLPFRAPSWSWASTYSPVTFIHLERSRRYRNGADEERQKMLFNAVSRETKMVIHDTCVSSRGQNPFGEVTSGTITLQGRVKVGLVTLGSTAGNSPSKLAITDQKSQEKVAAFYPDEGGQWGIGHDELDFITPWRRGFADRPSADQLSTRQGEMGCLGPSGISNSVGTIRKSYNVPQEIECLCIDAFPSIRAVAALAIEPLPPGEIQQRGDLGSPDTIYKPYRRIGFIKFGGIYDSGMSWFQDSPWNLIELF